jgi:hypothetical protein
VAPYKLPEGSCVATTVAPAIGWFCSSIIFPLMEDVVDPCPNETNAMARNNSVVKKCFDNFII